MNHRPLKHDEAQKTARFQHNEKLNALLDELALLLRPVQAALPYIRPVAPVGCIIGCPRSGTTLFQQWLASLGAFSYPSNLLTRFAYAPYVGALIQKMLFDPEYDYRGDFEDIQSGISFASALGKSKGALSCNEFQHFFRNYLPNFDLAWLDATALESADYEGLSKGLASIEAALGKPFTTKANLLQFNLSYFSEHIPSLFWLHIVREPSLVMQSILEARETYYGNSENWWSVKPREFDRLKDLDVHHQVAGQVFYTEKAIGDGLENISESRWIRIAYEEFCREPHAVYALLREKYAGLGCDLPGEYSGAETFEVKNEIRLPAADMDALSGAYEDFRSRE